MRYLNELMPRSACGLYEEAAQEDHQLHESIFHSPIEIEGDNLLAISWQFPKDYCQEFIDIDLE
jgi:hypothetical protein